MTDDPSKTPPPAAPEPAAPRPGAPPTPAPSAREQRLAAALRENLRRRKAQSRERLPRTPPED